MSEWSPGDGFPQVIILFRNWLVSHLRVCRLVLITDQLVSPATHIEVESSAFEELRQLSIRPVIGSGDYAYVDRSFGGAGC